MIPRHPPYILVKTSLRALKSFAVIKIACLFCNNLVRCHYCVDLALTGNITKNSKPSALAEALTLRDLERVRIPI